MKIMYMITTLGHGRGGHFYDLKVIASALNEEVEVFIINIGLNPSPVIDGIDAKVYNLYFNGLNFLSVLNKIIRIVSKEKPTNIHCFDTASLSLGRIISYIKKIPLAMSKCGGPNPTGYYPTFDNLIVMSYENLNYFKQNDLYKNTQIKYIPHRSSYIPNDNNVIDELKEIAKNSMVIMRISRITSHYESSLIQSINLANDLKERGSSIKLFIVGVIQSNPLYEKLKDLAKDNENIVFFTDDRYTINASKLIDSSDFVIGTGRGIMEAASKNKVLLTPMSNAKYPVLIDENNFESLFITNFSPRNNLSNYNDSSNFDRIVNTIQNKDKYMNAVDFIEKEYKTKFDIKTAIPMYIDFYSTMNISSKTHFFNLIRSILSTVKNIYKASKKGIND